MLLTQPQFSDIRHDAPVMPDFALSFGTEIAYRADVAGMVTAALHDRFAIDDSMCVNIETCLREAVINAVVHGNLSLEGRIESQKDFESYYAAIEERISKARYKNRRVNITVWNHNQHLELRVSDEGKGFVMNHDMPEITLPYGRGLFLIRSLADSMWLAGDRRTLCMMFRY